MKVANPPDAMTARLGSAVGGLPMLHNALSCRESGTGLRLVRLDSLFSAMTLGRKVADEAVAVGAARAEPSLGCPPAADAHQGPNDPNERAQEKNSTIGPEVLLLLRIRLDNSI